MADGNLRDFYNDVIKIVHAPGHTPSIACILLYVSMQLLPCVYNSP